MNNEELDGIMAKILHSSFFIFLPYLCPHDTKIVTLWQK